MMLRQLINVVFLSIIAMNLVSVSHAASNSLTATNLSLSEFIDWASRQTLENYVLNSGDDCSVSLSVPAIDKSDVISLVSHVVGTCGLTLVNDNGINSIVSEKSAGSVNDTRQDIEISVIPILYSDAKSVFSSIISLRDNFDNVSLTVLPQTNSLMVSAGRKTLIKFERAIAELDVSVSQVLIEAIVFDVSTESQNRTGFSLSAILEKSGFSVINDLFAGLQSAPRVIYTSGDIQAVIGALDSNSDVKLISTPQILVRHGKSGRISVGQNVPFLGATEVTDSGRTVQNIERRDVGFTLTVKPTIVGDRIVLDVSQVVSSISESVIASDIVTDRRSVSTVIELQNGQTVQLGGLVSESIDSGASHVPKASKIPFFGRFLKSSRRQNISRELSVLIKVHKV